MWLREFWERYSAFMDRFHVARWKRWLVVEPLSEMATLGLGGLIVMLSLAVPAFHETADENWLKKSDLAVPSSTATAIRSARAASSTTTPSRSRTSPIT